MLVFDFDGVLVDSLPQAIICVKDVLSQHGLNVPIVDRQSYNKYWNSGFLHKKGLSKSEKLKDLLRKLMLERSTEYRLNNKLLDHLIQKNYPMGIITSNSEVSVYRSMGLYSKHFQFIYGAESNNKGNLLRSLKNNTKSRLLYITDTANDIVLCNSLKIPVCGFSWPGAYHSYSEIKDASPSIITRSLHELLQVLDQYL